MQNDSQLWKRFRQLWRQNFCCWKSTHPLLSSCCKKILIQIYNGCEFVRPILDNTVVETFTALTLHYNYFWVFPMAFKIKLDESEMHLAFWAWQDSGKSDFQEKTLVGWKLRFRPTWLFLSCPAFFTTVHIVHKLPRRYTYLHCAVCSVDCGLCTVQCARTVSSPPTWPDCDASIVENTT